MSQNASRHRTTNLKPRAVLTVRDVLRIRAESLCDERSIRAWARGESLRETTCTRIERACSKLEIEVLA